MNDERALLCLDLGNSRLKATLWEGAKAGELLALPGADPEPWLEALAPLIPQAGGRAALCSVRPSLDAALLAGLRARGLRVWQVKGDSPVPFPVALRSRATLGADRLCNAAASWVEGLSPVLVVDAGTAVTVDLVDGQGAYLGGAILPGPERMLEALASGGEQLFRVAPDWPASPWGRDSAEALAAGALWGGLAALEGLARRYRAEWGPAATVLLTGGAAPALAERWREGELRLEPDWTLRGLAGLANRAD